MPYNTVRDVQKQNDCYLHGPRSFPVPPPPFPKDNGIYQTNADPANPLRCTPRDDKK